MATIQSKSNEMDESKFEDEKYVDKLKSWSEKVGLSLQEIKEKKISKNQLKKMFKQKLFKSMQGDLRKKHREKRKKRKRELIEKNEHVPVLFTKMAESKNKMKIVIDMSYGDLMSDRELQKTFKQIQRCYSVNRRSTEPCQFYLTSFNGKIKEKLSAINMDRWDIYLIEQHWYDYFNSTGELSKLTFLTPDSENTLSDSEQLFAKRDDLIFVIGGLVDHNFHKNLTAKLAEERSVKSAKFPIDEYIKMAASKVLTINHCFEIMLSISHGQSWQKSLGDVVPLRKTFGRKSNVKSEDQISESSGKIDDQQTT